MTLLDRYALRNFLEPFLICSFGFLAIWLVFDLSGNMQDFIEYHTSPRTIFRFYLTQVPAVLVLSIPVGLLLALLFSLTKMSRHNEIISMITAGRSIIRILIPFFGVGLLASAACYWLNATAAPHAETVRKQMFDEITRGAQKAEARATLEGHLFRDRMNNRTWYVRRLAPNSQFLEGVHITQQDAVGNVMKKWYAARATYDAKMGTWALFSGMAVEFDRAGNQIRRDDFPGNLRVMHDWTETPWRIASSQVLAQNLSVDELHDYLRFNADFPEAQLAPYRTNLADRFSFPWSNMVVVFLAAPLGIVYNRRGVIGGVAGALSLFFIMFALRYLCLAFGKGGRLPPEIAAWLPDVMFLLIGMVLLYFRATNRDFPKLAFWR